MMSPALRASVVGTRNIRTLMNGCGHNQEISISNKAANNSDNITPQVSAGTLHTHAPCLHSSQGGFLVCLLQILLCQAPTDE